MTKAWDKIEFYCVGDKLFSLGRSVTTPGALVGLTPQDIICGLMRHGKGDWGQLSQEDREENNRALTEGGRLFSRYEASNGRRFWIITEADRSVTTVLLPEEY